MNDYMDHRLLQRILLLVGTDPKPFFHAKYITQLNLTTSGLHKLFLLVPLSSSR